MFKNQNLQMSEKLKKFDFFTPVLSTDVVKEAEAIPDYKAPLNPNQSTTQIKKVQKNQKEKKKDPNFPVIHKVETQEEIDAWIAERRKKYPTRVKIAEKEQTKQEREERGALDLSSPLPNKKKEKKSNKPTEMSSAHPTKIPSLLDEMCSDQTRADRSIILQCFRYFVQHNFLQDEKQIE